MDTMFVADSSWDVTLTEADDDLDFGTPPGHDDDDSSDDTDDDSKSTDDTTSADDDDSSSDDSSSVDDSSDDGDSTDTSTDDDTPPEASPADIEKEFIKNAEASQQYDDYVSMIQTILDFKLVCQDYVDTLGVDEIVKKFATASVDRMDQLSERLNYILVNFLQFRFTTRYKVLTSCQAILTDISTEFEKITTKAKSGSK